MTSSTSYINPPDFDKYPLQDKPATSNSTSPVSLSSTGPQKRRDFSQFLVDKARDGFSVKEELGMRGIEFITAKSLGEQIKAFFALGKNNKKKTEKETKKNHTKQQKKNYFYR